jgi:hypothetical protein
MPLELSTATCAFLILEAATICEGEGLHQHRHSSPIASLAPPPAVRAIGPSPPLAFMALVILPMFLIALILILTAAASGRAP